MRRWRNEIAAQQNAMNEAVAEADRWAAADQAAGKCVGRATRFKGSELPARAGNEGDADNTGHNQF